MDFNTTLEAFIKAGISEDINNNMLWLTQREFSESE